MCTWQHPSLAPDHSQEHPGRHMFSQNWWYLGAISFLRSSHFCLSFLTLLVKEVVTHMQNECALWDLRLVTFCSFQARKKVIALILLGWSRRCLNEFSAYCFRTFHRAGVNLPLWSLHSFIPLRVKLHVAVCAQDVVALFLCPFPEWPEVALVTHKLLTLVLAYLLLVFTPNGMDKEIIFLLFLFIGTEAWISYRCCSLKDSGIMTK